MTNEDFLNPYLDNVDDPESSEFTTLDVEPLFNSDDDVIVEGNENNLPPESSNPGSGDNLNPNNTDVLSLLLREKGISNPDQIDVENEDGTVEQIKFSDLSIDEQIELLRDQKPDFELNESEQTIIDYFRTNQLTFDELIEYAKQQGVQEYMANAAMAIDIESLSDDEIFLADLLTRIPDITDNEAQEQLDIEKQNENLYTKKVNALRQELIAKEQQRNEFERDLIEKERAESFDEFKQSLSDVAPSIKEIGGRIELDESDLNETIEFLLAEDATGVRYIAKALNDPQSLIKMAWFYTKGEEAINSMAEYYEDTIKNYAKNNYLKGYNDGKDGKQPEKGTQVVRKPKSGTDTRNVYSIPKNPALVKS